MTFRTTRELIFLQSKTFSKLRKKEREKKKKKACNRVNCANVEVHVSSLFRQIDFWEDDKFVEKAMFKIKPYHQMTVQQNHPYDSL